MKKRLLSALLALALVFVLLPTTALAETPAQNADIYIAGTGWNFEKDGSTYQTVYYQIQSGTGVFLKEFGNEFGKVWTTDPYLEITRVENDVTITVHGKMEISSNESCIQSVKSYSNAINLIITGTKNDTLTLTNSSIGDAIYSYNGDVTIKDGITVNACSTYFTESAYRNARGICVYDHDLTISGANTTVNVESKAAYPTVKVDGTITVSGGAQLNATNKYYGSNNKDKAYAIECGQLSISGDKTQVTAKTSNGEKAISGKVSDGDKLTFKVQLYLASSTLDQKPMDEALKYTHVVITQAPTDPYVFIAGEPAIIGQETPIPGGSGTYLYVDAGYDGNILTLKDATINKTSNKDTNAIKFTDAGTYTVNLEGTNKISNVSTGILAANVQNDAINVIISGSGSLDISAKAYAIEVPKGDLTFNGTGNITLTTSNISTNRNVLSVSGNITITDMDKYSVTGITQTGSPNVTGDTVTLSEASHLKGYQNPGDTQKTCLKSITIAPKPSETYYNGTAMKYGATKIVGSGTISCDENGVITMTNVNDPTGTLSFEATLADSTLVLEGTNTLSSIVTTQKGLTISGSGSLTAGSIKVHNQTSSTEKPNLTINGATVTVGNAEITDRAIDTDGDLTVTNGSLTATSNSNSVPTVQVGGNATFTGSTVTITNNSTTQGKSGEYSYEVSTGLYVGGTLDIKNAAKVTSTVTGGNAIYAKGDITISGNNTEVKAQNSAYKFSAISTNGTVNISDNSTVKAENLKKHQGDGTGKTDPSTGKTYNACPAITGKIANKNTQNKLHIAGFTTSNPGSNPKEGVVLNFDINPSSAERYILHYDVTITRGDAYTTPQVAANYTIAGQTMYVGKYYKIDANGNITDGTAQDYNIYCDSENDFTLNNATISSTGTSGGSTGVIMTNLDYSGTQIHIKLIGTNSINNIGHHAILGEGENSRIIIENAENASNASLTISGNFLPVYSYGYVTINAEVVIKNTDGKLISTKKDDHANGAFDLGSGYKCYASTSTTGTPLEEFNSANYSTYKYLRITKETLETGGGSTHQHTYDQSAWKSDATHHWQECTDPNCPDPTKGITNKAPHSFSNGACTVCGYRGQTEEHHFSTDWTYDETHHWHACTDDGCTAISGKAPHEWTGWLVNDDRPEVHAQRCNCGYLGSTHSTLKYVAIDSNYHQKQCPIDGCGYKLEYTTTSHVYEEGSNICTECGYDKSAPCDHTGDLVYTNNGDGTHKVTCNACGATIVEKQSHEFDPTTGACIWCGATQSGGDPTPDNPGTIVIIRPAEEEKPAQQPNPSTGANDLVGLAVAAAVAAALGSAALLRKHD